MDSPKIPTQLRFLPVLIFVCLCPLGCSKTNLDPITLSTEQLEVVVLADSELQTLETHLGRGTAEFSSEFEVYVLQLIELLRAEFPGKHLAVRADSEMGKLIGKYSSPKFLGNCITNEVVDLECLHRAIIRSWN